MDLNIIKKIFPHTEKYNLLSYDSEGLYSITLPNEADEISSLIKNLLGNEITLCDATAGIGGNTISFGKNFKNVISIELCKNRYNILDNNVKAYELSNINLINDSCLNKLNLECSAYFFDPPWALSWLEVQAMTWPAMFEIKKLKPLSFQPIRMGC